MPHIQTHTCGTPGLVNVSTFMQTLVPLKWFGVQQVANRSFVPSSPGTLLPSAAVCNELIDWGTAIVARQASQAAGHLVPGVSILHHAYQAYRALTAVQQGNIYKALQQIPLSAVVPAGMRELLRNILQQTGASSIRSLPDHDQVVLLLAAGALLCHLKTMPTQHQTSATSATSLRLLRSTRTTLECLRGLRTILSVPNTVSRDVPLLAADAHRPASAVATTPANATSQEGSGIVATLLPALNSPSPHQDPPGNAWPFPGALAAPAPGKKDGANHPPRSGQGSKGHARGSAGTGLQRSNAIRRKGGRRDGGRASSMHETAVQVRGNAASRSPAAMAGHADSAKESMQSPLKHSQAGQEGREERRHPQPGGSSAAGRADPVAGQMMGGQVTGSTAISNRPASNIDADTDAFNRVAGIDTISPVPECIEFDDVRILSLLVRSRRYQPTLMHVCVRPEDSPLFKEWVTLPADSHRGMGRWMVSEAIHEDVPHALRDAPMRRFGARGETVLESVPRLVATGSDRVFTLLTMSLLDEPLRREAAGWDVSWMQANSFRVVQHKGLDGIERHYLAYFLHRELEIQRGIRGGFLEVWADTGGMLGVDDGVHDIRITAPTLENLVLTLQKLTGLRYIGARRSAASQAMASPATNLFVNDGQILAAQDPSRHLPYNHALQLFAPVMVELPDQSGSVPLYHGSFMLLDNVVAYADETGQGGLLHFARHIVGDGARQLRCLTPPDCVFAARKGLKQGVFYTAEQVRQELQQNGLISLHDPEAGDGIDREPAPQSSTLSTPATLTPTTTPDPWPESLPARSTFSFQESTLHYVDHDGRHGMLDLERVRLTSMVGYRLPHALPPAQRLFAARNDIAPGVVYPEEEIEWLLAGQGYIRMPY